MNESRTLARWVAETPFDALPEYVKEQVRIFVLDSLASGFAGAGTPWAGMVADLARESSTGSASLFGRGWTSSLSAATLYNGTCIGGFETDAPYSPGSCHPSAAVFPAVIAAAEQRHLDGRAFMAAIAV
jgi:2-methylcitrate dehydratase PrpD